MRKRRGKVIMSHVSAHGVRLALVLLAGAALFAAGVTVSSAEAATSQKTLTLYAVASKYQFIDHADDRARGLVKNPFNADIKQLDPKAREYEKGKGPYPGDDALFTFKLYSDASLKKRVGSAVYECVYNFNKHAMCNADFDLSNGSSLFAAGPIDFNSPDFALAVTGGTGKYLGAHGQVSDGSKVQAANTHRVDFQLG